MFAQRILGVISYPKENALPAAQEMQRKIQAKLYLEKTALGYVNLIATLEHMEKITQQYVETAVP